MDTHVLFLEGRCLVLHTYIKPKSNALLNIVLFGRISPIDILFQHVVP